MPWTSRVGTYRSRVIRILISTFSSMEKSQLHRVLVITTNTGFLSPDIIARARIFYQGQSMSWV